MERRTAAVFPCLLFVGLALVLPPEVRAGHEGWLIVSDLRDSLVRILGADQWIRGIDGCPGGAAWYPAGGIGCYEGKGTRAWLTAERFAGTPFVLVMGGRPEPCHASQFENCEWHDKAQLRSYLIYRPLAEGVDLSTLLANEKTGRHSSGGRWVTLEAARLQERVLDELTRLDAIVTPEEFDQAKALAVAELLRLVRGREDEMRGLRESVRNLRERVERLEGLNTSLPQ